MLFQIRETSSHELNPELASSKYQCFLVCPTCSYHDVFQSLELLSADIFSQSKQYLPFLYFCNLYVLPGLDFLCSRLRSRLERT